MGVRGLVTDTWVVSEGGCASVVVVVVVVVLQPGINTMRCASRPPGLPPTVA